MTYCLGIAVEDGLLMIADTRTNAGVDNISSYRKLHCLEDEPDRQVYLACSGNLSVSQAVLARLATAGEDGRSPSIFDMAGRVGQVLRRENAAVREALGPNRTCAATMLLGGRIGSEKPRLFLIYAEGNFIECMADLPYMQIGETKYGRPILDRVITRRTPLPAAIKAAFLSFDSTMRSNLSVARPLDMVLIPADASGETLTKRIEQDDAYFNELSRRWSAALLAAADAMPEADFLDGGAGRRGDAQVVSLRAC